MLLYPPPCPLLDPLLVISPLRDKERMGLRTKSGLGRGPRKGLGKINVKVIAHLEVLCYKSRETFSVKND